MTDEPGGAPAVPSPPAAPDLVAVAEQFALGAPVQAIAPLGGGNVNDTYLVQLVGAPGGSHVLQRLNTHVFRQPRDVMRNLLAFTAHAERQLQAPASGPGRRWEVPRVVPLQGGADPWLECDGAFWRMTTFIGGARSLDQLSDTGQAREVGYGLGRFHRLVSDLPVDQLVDTLEGFHITPTYLAAYHRVCAASPPPASPELRHCAAFVAERQRWASVLEDAKGSGRLQLRPIHGDPKVNNVLIDAASGAAISLVDLDTVKPGLIHYDIGDCLRSACNLAGEEAADWRAVRFDTGFCAALLEGYAAAARSMLTTDDVAFLYDAIRLLAFELGVRFLTDHLAGDVYFKVRRPGQNLQRALVQFALAASIEAQEAEIRAIVAAVMA
jgi:Ser/Thr protein kinase RdoA (MazF antagonist)